MSALVEPKFRVLPQLGRILKEFSIQACARVVSSSSKRVVQNTHSKQKVDARVRGGGAPAARAAPVLYVQVQSCCCFRFIHASNLRHHYRLMATVTVSQEHYRLMRPCFHRSI